MPFFYYIFLSKNTTEGAKASRSIAWKYRGCERFAFVFLQFNFTSFFSTLHFLFDFVFSLHSSLLLFTSIDFKKFFFHTSFFSSLRFIAKANTVNTFIYYSLNTIIIIIRRDAQYTDKKVDGWHKQSVGWHHLSAILAWRRNRCYDFFYFLILNVLR